MNKPPKNILVESLKGIKDQGPHLSIGQAPIIDMQRMRDYRLERIRQKMRAHDMSLCVLVNPISLRYALDYRNYSLFQSHIPSAYAFIPVDGPLVLHGGYDPAKKSYEVREARPLSPFDGGPNLSDASVMLAQDIDAFLHEIGCDNRRVAIEYINPSVTLACTKHSIEVCDGVSLVEEARQIKSIEEIQCMRWSIKVAQHGISQIEQALAPGVTELELWALLNFINIAHDGDWHDGRMLASGSRINPWCQEASSRRIKVGDLVGLDTDMIGPFGYCADVSRTFLCGNQSPTARQRYLYQLAVKEIEHNCKLIGPGITLEEIQHQAFQTPEEFHANAYTCIAHGVGMCDEQPRINPIFRGTNPYQESLEAGMVICVESYIGAVGERDGVKLEQQLLVTEDGSELLSSYPFDERLMS